MGKFKYTLSNIWFWVVIAIGCFVMESVYFFTIPGVTFFHESFWILAIAGIGSSIVYFYLEHKKNNLKFDKVALPFFIVVFLIFAIIIWTHQPETFVWENGMGENVISMSIPEKMRYTVMLFFSMLTAYMILFTHSHNMLSTKRMVWLPIAYVVFALANILISLVTEFAAYKSIFENGSRELSINGIYNNENMFGVIILIAICACAVINYKKPNIPTFIAMTIFFVWTILIGSGTCIICAVVFLPIYLFIEVARGIKYRPIKTAIWTSAFAILFIGFIIIFIYGVEKNYEPLVNLNNYINIIRIDSNNNFGTLTGRVTKWVQYLNFGSDTIWHLLFGRGFIYNNSVVTAYLGALYNMPEIGSISCENGFVQLFIHGGLLAVVSYIAINVYFVYCCIYLFINKKKSFAALYLLIFIIMTMNNFLEVNLFFDLSGKEAFITIAFFAPVIAKYKQMKHKNGVKLEEVSNMEVENKPVQISTITQVLSVILVGLLTVAIALVPAAQAHPNGTVLMLLVNGILALITTLMFFPYLISLWWKGSSKRMFFIQIFSNLIFIFGGTLLATFVIYIIPETRNWIAVAAQVSYFLILLGYTFVYSLLRKGNGKEYLQNTFIKPLSMSRFAGPITMVVIVAASYILKMYFNFNQFTIYALAIAAASIYLAALFLIPNKPKNDLEEILNDKDIALTVKYVKRSKELNG